MNKTDHNIYMQKAITLAKRGLFTASPNPRVGCVIVDDKYHIIGEGFHQKTGLAHAEVNALNQAKQYAPEKLSTATAYVTLEPCSHFGNTPPCAQALIDANISRVIIGSKDPNPKVLGKGVAMLEQAGIEVISNIMTNACDSLNLGFFQRMTQKKPWVRLKIGMSLDAKIATQTGESKWITGKKSREDVQFLRAKSDAILTSATTAIIDNPKLNVRLSAITNSPFFSQPKKVIVDHRLSTPNDLNLFSLDGDVIIYHNKQIKPQFNYNQNTQLIGLPINQEPSDNEINHQYIDFNLLLSDLAINHQCNNLLIEAGGRFAGNLLQQQLIDELIIYTAPKLLGTQAKPAFNFKGNSLLTKAFNYQLVHSETVGQDIKATYRKSVL